MRWRLAGCRWLGPGGHRAVTLSRNTQGPAEMSLKALCLQIEGHEIRHRARLCVSVCACVCFCMHRGEESGGLGMPAARQLAVFNTCLSAPTVPLCNPHLHLHLHPPPYRHLPPQPTPPYRSAVQMTEEFISCTRMRDMSHIRGSPVCLFRRCISTHGIV